MNCDENVSGSDSSATTQSSTQNSEGESLQGKKTSGSKRSPGKPHKDVEPGYYWARYKLDKDEELRVYLVIDDGGYFCGSLLYTMLSEVEIVGTRLVPPGS